MGVKLLEYYKYIKGENGLIGEIKLAQMTKLPSTKAAMAPDSGENIEIFKKAVQHLTGKPAPNL